MVGRQFGRTVAINGLIKIPGMNGTRDGPRDSGVGTPQEAPMENPDQNPDDALATETNIVVRSKLRTQGSGQLYAELYGVARKRCRAVLGAMSACGTETGAFQTYRFHRAREH